MNSFEPRIMPFVRQKIEKEKEEARARKADRKKRALFTAYEQVDLIFGKPLSVLNSVKIISFPLDVCWSEEIVFSIDTFVFRYKWSVVKDKRRLYIKSKKWYRNWYNTQYSAKVFKELVDKGKI